MPTVNGNLNIGPNAQETYVLLKCWDEYWQTTLLFTPEQARRFAHVLTESADAVEQANRGTK
jgi:hypothetical protein